MVDETWTNDLLGQQGSRARHRPPSGNAASHSAHRIHSTGGASLPMPCLECCCKQFALFYSGV